MRSKVTDSNQYDVFLAYNPADLSAVEALAAQLEPAQIKTFVADHHLIPGEPRQESIECALERSGSCAVLLGPSGIGPWQNEEMRIALERRVECQNDGMPFRIIPVRLPGSPRAQRGFMPRFLTHLTWVIFSDRLDDERAFHALLCGIRGIAPGPGPGEAIDSNVCPYHGLQIFDVAHFFQDRAQVFALAASSSAHSTLLYALKRPPVCLPKKWAWSSATPGTSVTPTPLSRARRIRQPRTRWGH